MRNNRFFGMSYTEREAHRLKRKAEIASGKNVKQNTLDRLKDMVIVIEDAVKPEADRLRATIFNMTMEKEIIAHNLISPQKLIEHAEKDAAETVEANKYKLLDGVARYMGEYQTAIVIKTDVRTGMKGFQGEFIIDTDKGRILFTCKAITAEGPVVSFHWRYIIHVKHIK